MALTFANTYNMIAFLTKSDASEDRRKVILTEDTVRQALRLDDANCIDCLPNEEIFAELARMGYEKPSTKLTFYKAFFSAQWKFLIHTILHCMSAKRTAWNEVSYSMASAVICLATGKGGVGSVDISLATSSSSAASATSSRTCCDDSRSHGITNFIPGGPLCTHTMKNCMNEELPLSREKRLIEAHVSSKLLRRVMDILASWEGGCCSRAVGKGGVGSVDISLAASSSSAASATSSRTCCGTNILSNNREDASKQGGIAKLNADEDVTLEDVDAEKDAEVQGRLPESQGQ
nr:hypothetical protein [Tanacetum cinerariifolium]